MPEKISLGELINKPQATKKVFLGDLLNTAQEPKKTIPLPKEKYEYFQNQYSALDSTLGSLKDVFADLQKPFAPNSVENTIKGSVFGMDFVLPRVTGMSQKDVKAVTAPEKQDAPYKGLLKTNLKELNITEDQLNNDETFLLQNQVKDKFINDLNTLKTAIPEDISAFIQEKKNKLTQQKELERLGSSAADLMLNQENRSRVPKDVQDLNRNTEYNELLQSLDNVAKDVAFNNAPILYNNIDEALTMSQKDISRFTQRVGNDIENVTNPEARAYFKAVGFTDFSQIGQLRKDRMAYTGIQAEINAAYKGIGEDVKILEEKSKNVEDLLEMLKQNPTDDALIKEIQAKIAEVAPIKEAIDKKKKFITKLSESTFELPEFKKELENQIEIDENYEILKDQKGSSIGLGLSQGIKMLSNTVTSSMKGAAILGNEISKSLGRSESEYQKNKQNLLMDESATFTLPTKLSAPVIDINLKEKKFDINWETVAPNAVKTIGEMYLMGGVGAPLAKYGTFGKIAGLYAGSAAVFGGSILQEELKKGLTFGEASAITGLRLSIEAGTELINLNEFIPFNGVAKGLSKTVSKRDFVRFVGDNWKTLFPKLKAKGINVADFLRNSAESMVLEPVEEVLADLGNYGLDNYIIENIKPDYSSESSVEVDDLLVTAFTTALTMSPYSIYQGYKETKSEMGDLSGIRLKAAQTPDLFIKSLDESLKDGYITKEYYNTAKQEIEGSKEIYNANKKKIDIAPKEEQPAYLQAIVEYEAISKQLLSETDLTAKEKLVPEVEKALQRVQAFDKEYLPLVDNPKAQQVKQEEIVLQNLDNIGNAETFTKATTQELETLKTLLGETLANPISENVKLKAEAKLKEVEEALTVKQTQPEQEEVVSPIEQVKQNIQTYSKEELEKYNPFMDKTLSREEKREANELKIQKLQEIADKEATTETTTTTEDGEVVTQGDVLFSQMGVKPVEVVEEELQKQEITFEGKRGQADSISFDNKTIKQGEEIELRDVNISQDDSMPDLRSGKYKVRMLSVDANGKTATLTLTDGNEVITTTVKDLRKSEQSSKEIEDKSDIEAKKADIEIGKVGNTEYEIKVDGVYYQGKKLNNPENKTYRQLIEADIERRRQEELNKKSTQGTLKNSPLDDISYYENKVKEAKKRLDKITKEEGEFVPGSDRELGSFQGMLNKAKKKVDDINSKYNEELKQLEQPTEVEEDVNAVIDESFKESLVEEVFPEHIYNQLAKLKNKGWLDKIKTSKDFNHFANSIKKNFGLTIGRNVSNPNSPDFKGELWTDEKLDVPFQELKSAFLSLDNPQTEVVIPQEVSDVKPQTAEKAEKEQEKEVVEKFTEPANPFKNGKVKTSNWNAVLSKITDLTLPNYRVRVVNTNSLTLEQLPFQTKKYFEDQARIQKTTVEDVMSKDKGKMLILTDKEGNYILEDGLPVVTNFPDGLLAEYKAQYERQGLSEEQYNDKINQIKQARKNNSTLLIERISNFPVEITQDSNELSVAVGTNDFSIAKGSKGFPIAMVGSQEVNLISRKLTENELNTIVEIAFNFGSSGVYSQEAVKLTTEQKNNSERYQKLQYLKNLIFTGKGITTSGKKKLNFEYFLKSKNPEEFAKYGFSTKITYGNELVTSKEQLREILKNYSFNEINVNKDLSESLIKFTTYKIEDGKIVVDKTYPTYKDFLKDTIKTKGVSATKLQDNFYIEVGDTDGTLSAKLEEAKNEPAVTPVIEVVEPTINTEIVEESQAVEEVKSLLDKKKKKSLDVPTDKDNFAGLLRSKKLSQEVIAEQNKKAKEWFDKSPLAEYISLNQLQNIVNSDAYASWNWGAITLFKGSQYTDLYHEAWHEFSQLYLTKKQKEALYGEIKNLPQYKDFTNEQIEEVIAEDFRNYAKSDGKLILNNRFKRNSTFRRVWNFLKELFTKTTDLQTVYERLYTGNISKYKRNTNNAFWGNLNLGIQLKDNKQLSDTDTKNLYRAIDSLIGTIFQQNVKPVTMMFADNKVLATVYGAIYKRLATEYNDLYDSIEERTTKNLSQGEAEQLKADAQLLDNLDVIIENWNEIVKTHRQYSAFFNISKDKIAFDEEGNITSVDDLFTEETDEGNSRNSELIKNENVSSKEMASNETIFTIATLRRYNSDGTVATNPFLPFVADIVDFNNTWDKLTTSVNNTLNYDQLIDKITELGEKDKSFKDLQDRLPDPNKTLSDDEQRMKGAFMNDISKPLVNVYELVMKPLNGKMLYSYNTAASSDVDKVKKQWNDNFESGSPFIKQHPDDSLYTDIAEIKATYSARGTKPAFYYNKADYNKADKTQMFENRIDFLSNMGIKFTEDLLSDIDFKDFIIQDFVKTDYVRNSPAFAMYDLITNAKGDISSLTQLYDKQIAKPSTNAFKYYAPTIEALANYEVLGSNSLFAQSVKNAANNSVWQIRQWNYITKIFNALNDVQKYPTYQDLIKEDWLKQFDFEANPYVKGIYLNTLFDLNPESTTYGQRRVIKKGKQTIYPTISLHDYNGMRLNASEGKANEGKQTTGLTAFEKIVQNINSLLLFNTQENLRYGDKSSSYSTMISHYLTANGKLEDAKDRKSIISFSKFTNGGIAELLPTEAYKILVSNLKQEVIPMIRFKNDNVGVNLRHYNKNIKDFGTFNNILTEDTKDKIQKQIIDANVQDEKEISKILLSLPLREEFETYIATKSEQLSELLDTDGLLNDLDLFDPKLVQTTVKNEEGENVPVDLPKQSIYYAYIVNSLLYNMEHTKLISFDPRFYKTANDVIKRLSAWSATGNMFIVDAQTNEFIRSKGNAIKDAIAKKLKTKISDVAPDGSIRSVIFTDNKYSANKLLESYKEKFLATGKYTAEQLNTILKAYTKIEEGDGQGYVTLDLLRQSKLRAGSSHWTKEHEAAYQKEAKFINGESTEGMSLEEMTLFTVQKWQYAGIGLENGIPYPTFYKFSVVPLIPSAIEKTKFKVIHENLIKQNVGLGLFESGSKASSNQEVELNPDGSIKLDKNGNPITKSNPFYSDYAKRKPFEGEYTINNIFFQYLKEQVNIEPKLKGETMFSTQMRKLLHLNLYNNGVPNDVKLSVKEWNKLSKTQKIAQSDVYKQEQKFGEVIEKLVEIERNSLLKKMGATQQPDGNYKIDAEKLSEFFREEFIKRDLPNEVVNYLQAENGEFKFPIDAFKQRATIERIAYSIANKKLVQQKMTGEALIQVASTGFELTDKFSEVREDNDLPFYTEPGKAQKVKIAFTERWKPLLNLEYKGAKVETLDRLNEAIKDEEWLEKNRKVITIVGVRIPVQGLNSQEYMEVFHFLPESMGGVIIVSPALVAKSGGDFDVDKLTTFFPNFTKNGKLNTLASKEEVKSLKKQVQTLTRKFENISKDIETTDIVQENLTEEIETYLFNLFEEDEDIVLEAKKELKNIEKTLSKLEGKSAKIWNEIQELQAEIEQKGSPKKAYENELIDLIRETLSRAENFQQLVRPNDTDLLNNTEYGSEKLKNLFPKPYQDNTFTSVVDFASILEKFKSNLVGKSNLGIAAVNNVFFALAQRAGLRHGKNFTYIDSNNKFRTKPVEYYLPHNTIEEDGEQFVSLSGLNSKNSENYISDIISQYINGFVDVANDDWIFFINAVKEFAPTMLYTAMAGTNAKTTIAFFNQPVMRDYIKNIPKYKNIFTRFKYPLLFRDGNWKALQDAAYKYIEQDDALKEVFDSGEDSYKYINVREYVKKNVSPDFLTEERLSEALFEDKPLSPQQEVFLIFHFWELQRQQKIVTNLQRSLNSDTKKVGTGYSSKERQLLFEDVEKSGLFNTDAMYRMRNESTVRAFTNDKTGFDTFSQQLFTDVFEVTNHPTFSEIIRELIKNDTQLKFEYKFSELEKLVNTIKNDFITYLYQNQVLDGNDNLFKKMQPLFNPKSSMALELKNLKEKYPNLENQFPILEQLIPDNYKIGNKILKTNLKLKKALADKDELDNATRQMRELIQFSSNSYTPEQQIEIQQFTDRLIKFIIVQSGLNPSVYNLLDIVPNEYYTQNIKHIIKDVQKALDKDVNKGFSLKKEKKSDSQKNLEIFYNRFKIERPTFFNFTEDEEGQLPNVNRINQRGVNYYLPKTDITGAKAQEAEDKLLAYIPTLPSKSITTDKTNAQTIRKNPKSLAVVYDNLQESNTEALKSGKVVNFATMTAKNKETIDSQIDTIIAKSMDYETISFDTTKGYFQDIRESNPELFNYGSQRLKDTFGITNPGFEEVQEQEVIEQPIQNAPETGKPGVFTVWHGSETDIKEFKSEFPEGFFHKAKGGSPKAIFFSKDKAPSDSVYGKRPYQKQFQVTMNNPLVVNYTNPKGDEGGKNREQWIQEAIDKGHDGVIWRNIHDNFITDVYVSLDSKKIKAVEQPINKEIQEREHTPEKITELKPNEVFVFGSNAEGAHGKGAALLAKQKFGAKQGQSEGLQGQSYAIITKKDWRVEKSSTLNEIANSIMKFVSFASQHPDKKFYVTKIGSALAGYTLQEIKQVWKDVNTQWESEIFSDIPDNIILPKEYEIRDSDITPKEYGGTPVEIKPNELQKQNVFTVKPIQAADKKAVVKASVANKYIGFGEGIANSSTELYRQQVNEEYNKAVKEANARPSTTNIPQNLQSGVEQYGTLQYANKEAQNLLGKNVTSIELIENGFRTRTTRTDSELLKYDIKVGSYIKMFGKDQFGNTKNVIVKITKITKGYNDATWYKEGWTEEGLEKLKKHTNSANAVEFEVVKPIANVGNYNSNDVVFVSIGGKRGDTTVRKEQQDKTIKEALKAIEAGATLITDNKSYVESSDYNEGEKRLAKNLEAKGYVYSEQTIDGQLLGVWNKQSNINTSTNVKGIEINSYQTGLGNSLTNVHYAKNGKSDFDIVPTDKSLKLTKEAKNKWGESVEAWYKSNNAQSKGIPEGVEGDKFDMDLMVGLITDKLTQYPNLVEQINQNGGLAFLQKSTHNMGSGRWSSKNSKNMFINSLIQAYKNVNQSTEIKPKIEVKSFKTEQGSIYTYLPDGRVQRFKTVENKQYKPQDLIVFVKFKDFQQQQRFLNGVQNREGSGTKVYVIDQQGNKYSKNSDIQGKNVKLALVETKTNKVLEFVETKQEPTIGYNTYDESRYVENGEPMRSMHIGNEVTEILTQEQPIVEETKEDIINKLGSDPLTNCE